MLCLIKLRKIDAYLQSEKIAEKRVFLMTHSLAANLNEFMKSESMKRIEQRDIRDIAELDTDFQRRIFDQ